MNIFRFGRGDFFGTIIPGAFLLANLMFVLPNVAGQAVTQQLETLLVENTSLLVSLVLVASYALGFALRLISPSIPEKLAVVLRLFSLIWYLPLKYSRSRRSGEPQSIRKIIAHWFKRRTELFPYIDWFFDYYLRNSPASFTTFFEKLVDREFRSNRDFMKGLTFVNQCKLYVMQRSPPLREEVINNEGLARFVSGMSLAILPSTLLLFLLHSDLTAFLVPIYIILLLIFLYRFPHVRQREAACIFVAYAICVTAAPESR